MADIDDYVDDASIADGAELWRRIPSWHFIYDENLGRMRPSTAAFEDHPNRSPMSVLLADVIFRGGRDAVGEGGAVGVATGEPIACPGGPRNRGLA
jgi:hypothetical protein